MDKFEKLLKKIEKRTLKLGVVGLGYVGLPLAVEKAKAGYDVIGFDVQTDKVEKINNGINYIGDVVSEDLQDLVKQNKLKATDDPTLFSELDAIAICVPTPLDIYKQPNMSYVVDSINLISQYISDNTLIVLESTTYPGTTEEILKPVLEESGFIIGETVYLAYSPERVDPGNKHFNTKNTPKVVGGVTDNCTKLASKLYSSILKSDIHEVSSPSVAEMEKILENTFRNINIALANEMAILCDKMNIDVWEVIDAASSKPYGFMPFYPGPGLGGHCIPIDPWYLTYKAREYNYHTKLIETAGEINDDMPMVVVNKISEILNTNSLSLKNSKILVLGLAYKKDIDDYRESPILKIIELLENRQANLTIIDPYIENYSYKGLERKTDKLDINKIEEYDLVFIATNHTKFDYKTIYDNSKIIFDTRNSYNRKESEKYYKI
ncbi:nucleotide sugar dehydrogenase [Mammaliicoccus vitulinus]|uniref:nucleotide sugar dehydrogenase n=1 Tax=Mammaliicoccus vitulinus TaxID=71237 RepID=UPI002DB92ADB|nr:nucleotide sugar dehydrogenase [Mammaliicoccus vitulinus]MEB7657768.1 nucleotide sugar dehydrogenase [Mammaliicoccus vitulinus]